MFLSAIKSTHRKRGSHWRFRPHLPGHIFEISSLFLWATLLQVVGWWMQISQNECEPINQQPHFTRLQPPHCSVSAANYFREMFLPMEKEPVIIIECIAKQKFSCKYIQGRDHILSMPVYTSINHCETRDSKWVGQRMAARCWSLESKSHTWM